MNCNAAMKTQVAIASFLALLAAPRLCAAEPKAGGCLANAFAGEQFHARRAPRKRPARCGHVSDLVWDLLVDLDTGKVLSAIVRGHDRRERQVP